MNKEDWARWFSVKGQEAIGHKQKFRKFCLNVRELFYCECGQILEQVTQRGYGVSTLREIQNLTGHNPEEPALSDPALSGALD